MNAADLPTIPRPRRATLWALAAAAALPGCSPRAGHDAPAHAATAAGQCPDLAGTYRGDGSRAHYDLVLNTLRLNHLGNNINPPISVLLTEDKEFLIQPHVKAPVQQANHLPGMPFMLSVREPSTAYRCEDGYLHLDKGFDINLHYDESQGDKPGRDSKSSGRKHAFGKNPAGALVIKTTHYHWREVSLWASGGANLRVPGSGASHVTYSLWHPVPAEVNPGAAPTRAKLNEPDLIARLLEILPAGARHTASTTSDGYRLLSFRWDSAATNNSQLSDLARKIRRTTPADVRNTITGPAVDGFDIIIAASELGS